MTKSRKPPQKGPYRGTAPMPYLSHYALESEITDSGQARTQINAFNNRYLALTQPYARAAELRAGQAFPAQQRAQIAAENVGAAPYRGMGSESAGLRRRLRDVGP